ncbi:probable cytochrome P450 12b2, mitochondrial isoform X2 [Ostrea edulis]|nr:probable cytochrome P450 12b2, mitochondrial isoform X2 [Ostrea edulis]
MKFRTGRSWIVVVSNPEYSQRVLSKPEKYPVRPIINILDVYYKRKSLSPGLAVLQGKEWGNLRKPANDQMLRPMAVTSYIPLLTPVADDFIAKYRSTLKIEDCLKTLVNFTTESIGMLCFNKRLGCLEGTSKLEFVEDLGTFFQGIDETKRHLKLYRYFETPLYKKFSKAADNLYRVAQEEMQKSLKEMDQLKTVGKLEKHLEQPNLLYALISHPGMTHGNAQSLILDLFVGGIDSTSNALTFLWHELASNQDKQERLFREIDSVVGKGNLSKEALVDMPYLKACVKESLRKNYPLSGGSFRLLNEENIIGGYQVPKGTGVMISLRNMSKSAKFYKDPDQFIPERFLRGDNSVDVETRHTEPFAYLPFGFGPRSCIGQRFAESEIYIITTKLIQAYHISLTPEVPKELEYSYRIFACPTTKVNLQLRERH